ncbi:MAG: MarR family winged helix-turn-helix transcriptional regulator [Thermoplasmata archaeon]
MKKHIELPDESSENGTVEALRNTYRTLDRRITSLLSARGLTRPQFLALKVVSDGVSVPMNKISDYLSVTPGNVTGIIDRLVKSGILRRKGKAGDRRKIMIELTRKGKETYMNVLSSYTSFLEKVLQELNAKERRELKKHLTKLEEALNRADI